MRGRRPVAWLAALCLLAAGCVALPRAPVASESPAAHGSSAGGSGTRTDLTGAAGARATGETDPGTGGAAGARADRDGAVRGVGPPDLIGRMVYRPTSTLRAVVDGVTALSLEARQDEVIVGSGDVLLSWQLDTHDARPFRGLLRTRGAEPAEVRTVLGAIQVRFAAPLPDRWEAWLDGVRGSHVTLVRKAEPTVALAIRAADGTPLPLDGAEAVVPDGPLRLQLTFDQPVDQGSLAAWLADVEAGVGQPLIVTQEPDDRWVVELGQAPAHLTLDLRSVVAASTGLPVAHHPVTLRHEATLPYLERVDLASGESERLLTLPPEITEAWPAPDGAYLALRGWEPVEGEMREQRGAVVDLAGNRLLALPLQAGSLQWAGGRLHNHPPGRAAEGVWQVWDPESGGDAQPLPAALTRPVPAAAVFSPDGRRAAYLGRAPGSGSNGDSPGRVPLISLDLATGERRVVPGFAAGWGQGWAGARNRLAWSPDGRRVAALDPVEPEGHSVLVIYDLERGERRVVGEPMPFPPTGVRLAWSPDGSSLLASVDGRATWVLPLDGGSAVAIPDSGHGAAFWDETGSRLLGARGPWEGVFVFSLADGSRTELGDGLPAGWAGDAVYVVRWPGAASRYVAPRL